MLLPLHSWWENASQKWFVQVVDHPQKKCFIQGNDVTNNWICFQLNITYDLFWRRQSKRRAQVLYFFSGTLQHAECMPVKLNKQTKSNKKITKKKVSGCATATLQSRMKHFSHSHLMYHISFRTAGIFCKTFSGYITMCCFLLNSNLWVANEE